MTTSDGGKRKESVVFSMHDEVSIHAKPVRPIAQLPLFFNTLQIVTQTFNYIL